jgi:polar amino acid transport system substrate-binding protein
MKRTIWTGLICALILGFIGCAKMKEKEKLERENREVTDLLNTTSADIEKDAAKTFEDIINRRTPYVSKDNPALYAFVTDTAVTVVAHPDTSIQGRSMKGVVDAEGKKFMAEIIGGAVKNGSGWVEYQDRKAEGAPAVPMCMYYKIVKGSDGKKYVVCVGKYKQ